MKCDQIQELLPVYWDLPQQDERRSQVDVHILSCAACREEFEIWRESTELIRSTIFEAKRDEQETAPTPSVSNQVMKRIYEDEPWRMPVIERVYSFSYTLRRNLTATIAFCLALFMFSFLYSLVYHERSDAASESIAFGIQPVASASSGPDSTINSAMLTASIRPQEPFMFKDGLIQSYPDYLLALSLLGLTVTLLIMNWLSRTKA